MSESIEAAARVIDPLAFAEQGSCPPRGYECHTPEQLSRTIAARRAHAIRVAERVVAAYLQHQWRPIETAPKDGVFVLITDGDVVQIGYYEDHLMAWRSDADQCRLWSDPTHWQPLPAPPERDGK